MSVKDPIVSAQVVLKTASGKNLITEPAVTAKNVSSLLPSETTKREAAHALHEKGFSTQASGPTLSVSGKKSLFEKVFRFRLQEKRQKAQACYVPDKEAIIPAFLKNSVAAIVFPEPVETFE